MASAAVSGVRSATDAVCPLRVHIRPAKQLAYLMGRCGHRPLQAFPAQQKKQAKRYSLHRTVLSMIVVAAQEHWRIDCHDKHNAPTYSPENFRQIRRCVSIFENLVGADAHIRPYKSTTVMYTVFRLQSRIEIRLWLSTIACSTFVSTASHKHRCKSAPE